MIFGNISKEVFMSTIGICLLVLTLILVIFSVEIYLTNDYYKKALLFSLMSVAISATAIIINILKWLDYI